MTAPLADRVARILADLDRLKATDLRTTVLNLGGRDVVGYQASVFGATKHRYELNPPADEAQVAAIESEFGRSLPADYRYWITHVANGGAGPNYGLAPIGDPLSSRNAVDVTADFLYTPDAHAEFIVDDATYEEQYDAREPLLFRGFLFLSDEGCGTYDVLIVRGSSASQVWRLDEEYAGAHPITHPVTGVPFNFIDWYEQWLTAALETPAPPDSSVRVGDTIYYGGHKS